MSRRYWQHAGNPRWGLQQLFKDINRGFNPRRPVEQPMNNNYNGRIEEHGTVGNKPIENSSPTYVYNNYNYGSEGLKKYQ